MRKTNNASPLVLIFLADAVAMTVEMVAARILSPYFGSSNAVWTAVIGVILLAGSIGNYWSSSLDTVIPGAAWYFTFYSDGCHVYDGSSDRSSGHSVRPVCSSRQN